MVGILVGCPAALSEKFASCVLLLCSFVFGSWKIKK